MKKKRQPRRRCWNFRVKLESPKGGRLCYRLADPKEPNGICSTCAIGGMDAG